MGACESKPPPKPNPYARRDHVSDHSALHTNNTPAPKLRRVLTTPSSAKHLKEPLLRRNGTVKPTNFCGRIPEKEAEAEVEAAELDKSFGLSEKFGSRYEVGEEVGRGHFGYTCSAIVKKGELKGQNVAVKIIPKSKMTSAVAIEDVRREITMLHTLTGHPNIIKFYDAFEDAENVYIVMELCKGGELLDGILARGGKCSEDWAKTILVQILNVVAFCHLQGVVHRDLKPENFLFASEDENSELKAIDFGLSAFIRLDQKLKEIVGSTHYFAPEVLHKSYGTEADVWSVGVIAYILLSGNRPFWAKTESGIFREIVKADPSFDENPWLCLSDESKGFVKCLLNKNPRQRLSAAQALCHPWIRNHNKVKLPLDRSIFRVMKGYMRSTSLRKAALKALSKTLTEDELFYLKEQFLLMCPEEHCGITLETIKSALLKNKTDAIKESHVQDYLSSLNALQYRRMHFEEFCAAAVSVHQLEAFDCWEERALRAYEIFDKDGNKPLVIEELASELNLSPSVPICSVLQVWIKHSDGTLSFTGFVKLLQGAST